MSDLDGPALEWNWKWAGISVAGFVVTGYVCREHLLPKVLSTLFGRVDCDRVPLPATRDSSEEAASADKLDRWRQLWSGKDGNTTFGNAELDQIVASLEAHKINVGSLGSLLKHNPKLFRELACTRFLLREKSLRESATAEWFQRRRVGSASDAPPSLSAATSTLGWKGASTFFHQLRVILNDCQVFLRH